MSDPTKTEPIQIEAISLNLTPEVGTDDSVVAVRVVPDGREGLVILGRSLRTDEGDDGRKILVDRAKGETLLFRPGSIHVTLRDIDRTSVAESDGYRPISDTVWRWLMIGNPASPTMFRYLLAAARRLDGTHALLTEVQRALNLSGSFQQVRVRLIRALSLAEILAVSFGRSIDLLDGLGARCGLTVSLPPALDAKTGAVRAIRNAFEHIEDRALGQVHGKPHPDALSVFDQSEFVRDGKLTYAGHSIGLRDEVPQMLLLARQHVYDIAVKVAGEARYVNPAIHFFAEAPSTSR